MYVDIADILTSIYFNRTNCRMVCGLLFSTKCTCVTGTSGSASGILVELFSTSRTGGCNRINYLLRTFCGSGGRILKSVE